MWVCRRHRYLVHSKGVGTYIHYLLFSVWQICLFSYIYLIIDLYPGQTHMCLFLCCCCFSHQVLSDSLQLYGITACQAPVSMEILGKSHWKGFTISSKVSFLTQGIQPASLWHKADSLLQLNHHGSPTFILYFVLYSNPRVFLFVAQIVPHLAPGDLSGWFLYSLTSWCPV